MKRLFFIILMILPLSCYNGLNDMYDELGMKAPICVNSLTGNDANDGRGWGNAKLTISGAINAAQPGDVIWAAGTFSANTAINKPVSIYGGFSGIESRRDDRDLDNKTIVSGTVSSFFDVLNTEIVIDGFKFTKTSGNSISVITASCSALIANCEFTGNSSNSVYLTTGSVEISKCSFSGNTASSVSAANCSVVITNSSFNGNTITAGSGGAIKTSLSSIAISDSEFRSNSVPLAGGAISATSGNTISITSSDFIDNSSPNSGGAIFISGDGSSLSINGGVFSGNRAVGMAACAGGAICSSNTGDINVSISLNGVAFIGNFSTVNGGALYLGNVRSIMITSCYFGSLDKEIPPDTGYKNYTSHDNGGAIYIAGSSSIFSGKITDSWFYNNESKNEDINSICAGGAIYSSPGTGNTLEIDNSHFIGNKAVHNGGAIYSGSGLTVTNSYLTDNSVSATNGTGGGVYQNVYASSTILFSGCTFTANKSDSSGGQGGAIYVTGANSNVIGCSFSDNSAFSHGGGFYSTNASLIIQDSEFKNNRISASGSYGGALCLFTSVSTIRNTLFEGNNKDRTSTIGGAVHSNGANLNIESCRFFSNDAASGGAISKWYNNLNITNSVFWKNKAAVYYGGAIYNFFNVTCNIYSSDFIGNTASGNPNGCGGAISSDAGTINIYNSIGYNNTAYSSGNFAWKDTAAGTIAYSLYPAGSLSSGWTIGLGCNTTDNPLFTDITNGDFSLTSSSPCRNTGDDSYIPSGITTDIIGNDRTVGTVDMGAYEAQ